VPGLARGLSIGYIGYSAGLTYGTIERSLENTATKTGPTWLSRIGYFRRHG